MSLEQIEQSLLQLSSKDRRRFAEWFYAHENELVPDDGDVHPSVKSEVLRRLEEVKAHPEMLESWNGTLARARARLNEFRRQKDQSRCTGRGRGRDETIIRGRI